MDTLKKLLRYLGRVGIMVLQLIMIQLVTLFASFFFPGMENFPQTKPVLFVVILGITYTIGVFLVGWLAIRLRWIRTEPKYRLRLFGTLVGAYVPLVVALFLYHPLEPGNPFFFIAMLTSILGFYVPSMAVS